MQVFDFGANWQAFSEQRVDDQRLADAVQSLQTLLGRETLRGLRFLDVGCGSGLFSIAAHQLGATHVTGVDINPRCIDVCQQNHQRFARNVPITFRQGPALDLDALQGLGMFDLVYAWGSLHHTGAMWAAISNTAKHVAPGGTFVVAIYNKHFTSPTWRFIKWFYNQMPSIVQRLMALVFGGIIYLAKLLVTRRNPLEKERGMDFWYDVIDWVGGYPYEYASLGEIEAFMQRQGFVLRRAVPAQVPTGCNEFVFERGA